MGAQTKASQLRCYPRQQLTKYSYLRQACTRGPPATSPNTGRKLRTLRQEAYRLHELDGRRRTKHSALCMLILLPVHAHYVLQNLFFCFYRWRTGLVLLFGGQVLLRDSAYCLPPRLESGRWPLPCSLWLFQVPLMYDFPKHVSFQVCSITRGRNP